jgi:ribosomal protein L37AE/L43A
MTKEQALAAVEKAIDIAYNKGFQKGFEAQKIAAPETSPLHCASCGYKMNFNKIIDEWKCRVCGHTSQGYL